MESLYNLNYDQMCEYALDHGWKSYRGHQIFQWLYRNRVFDIDEMSNVSKETREILKKDFIVNPLELIKKQVSHDGTTKFLFKTSDGALLESVMMVFDYGRSVCVSSQVGCNMGCAFCASGLTKKKRDLTSGEMVAQVMYVQKELDKDNLRLSHIVVMGTGEPFDNFESLCRMIELLCSPDGLNISHRNITVSTCGIVPKIYEFADRNPQVTLAISLHSPNDTMRRELMPIANKYSMDELMEAARYYTRTTGRRITFEYSLVKGVNDKKEHAQELISRVKGMNCHINLIPVNPIKERDFEQSTQNNVAAFKHILERQHIQVTVRREMGRDIQAACGQLRKSYKERSGDE